MMIVYRMSLFGYFQTSFVETIRNPKFSFYKLKNTPSDVSHMMWLRGRCQTSADRAVRILSGFTVRYLSDIIENLKFSVEGFRVSGFRIWTWFSPSVCQTPHSKSGPNPDSAVRRRLGGTLTWLKLSKEEFSTWSHMHEILRWLKIRSIQNHAISKSYAYDFTWNISEEGFLRRWPFELCQGTPV